VMPELPAKLNAAIEPMTLDDLDAVTTIERASFPTVWHPSAYLGELQSGNTCYLVARWESEVIGFAGMWLLFEEGHITTLAVKPEYRRHGVGKALLIGLIREALRRGGSRLTLEVREGNAVARTLYEQFGFAAVAYLPRYYVDTGEDAVVMWVTGIDSPEYLSQLQEAESKR